MASVVGAALRGFATTELLPALVVWAGGVALRHALSRVQVQPDGLEGPPGRRRAALQGGRGRPGRASRVRRPRPRAEGARPAHVALPVVGPPVVYLLPAASVLSHVPGRVRFRVAGLRGDEIWAGTLAARLSGLPGVRGAEVNVRTGTALVHYDARRTGLPILQAALDPPPRPRPPAPGTGRPRLRLVEP